MPMREDCTFYESRTYTGGEVARFCTLDLAPEAPWRCPENCPKYERIVFIEPDFEKGSLANSPSVPDAPDADPDAIAAVLDAAEDIVNAAGPQVLAELEAEHKRQSWWRRRGKGRGGKGGPPGLSSR